MHPPLNRWRVITVAVVTAAAGLAAVPASPAQAQAQPSCISVTFSATTWSTGPDTGGFAINLTLTNTCQNTTISGWTLELTFAPDHELQQGWSANWTVSGSNVTATGTGWNSVLHPGQSTSIGFIGSYSGTYQDPLGCTINGLPCDGYEPNQPPLVALTSPADGGVLIEPCPVRFAADAVDPDGQVQLVEFYLNDTLVGSDDTAPYELTIPSNHPALVDFSGPNTAYAQAYDDGTPSRSGSSPQVEFIQVPPPPALMIIACNRPDTLAPGGSHVVHFVGACAGPVEVEVTVAGDPGITADPSSFTLADRQDVTITAAPDAAGATATVRAGTTDDSCAPATVQVTVAAAGNQPPQVTLTSPQDGLLLPSPCPIQLAADAVDPDGEITRVDFYVNSRLVGSDEEAPYELRIPGNHPSLGFGADDFAYAEAFDDGDPPLAGVSEVANFSQAPPPPALMMIACPNRVEVEPGGSEVVNFQHVCGPGTQQVELRVAGDPAITADPTSFEVNGAGQDVTISAAPGSAGATATVEARPEDTSCNSASVQVTVVG